MKTVIVEIQKARNGLIVRPSKLVGGTLSSNDAFLIPDGADPKDFFDTVHELFDSTDEIKAAHQEFKEEFNPTPEKRKPRPELFPKGLSPHEAEMLPAVIKKRRGSKVYIENINWPEPRTFDTIEEAAAALKISDAAVHYYLNGKSSPEAMSKRGIVEIRRIEE